MRALDSVIIAFSMFSRVPMPKRDWNVGTMRWVMAAFPLVGVCVGALVFGWGWLCAAAGFGPFLRGAGFFILPALFTGGIHLDGFCDVADALASHTQPERAREIMADSHLGAFAAIGLAVYALAFAGVSSELAADVPALLCFALLFVLSRALSGLAVVFFPCAKDSGLARAFADSAARTSSAVVLLVFAACCAALLLWQGGVSGGIALALCLLVLLLYRRTAVKRFGGINGDLAGWFLQLCELAGLAGLVAGRWLPV